MTSNEQLIYSILLGYTVNSLGEVYKDECLIQPSTSLNGRLKVYVPGKRNGFLQFFVHRLQAYQKYGEAMFEPGIVVRHLNGNPLDNSWDNIGIGTQQDNMLDIPKEQRAEHALIAAKVTRKLSWEDMEQLRKDREQGDSYRILCSRYGLAKSTVSYIVNLKTYTRN